MCAGFVIQPRCAYNSPRNLRALSRVKEWIFSVSATPKFHCSLNNRPDHPAHCFPASCRSGPDKCDKAVTDKRPVNLDLGTIALPITAIASILHRITGVLLVAGVALLLWMLDASLASEESFNALKECMGGVLFKLVLWAVLSGLIYHTAAGIKHLVMDLGYGETMEGGVTGARLVFIVTVLSILIVGAWIW